MTQDIDVWATQEVARIRSSETAEIYLALSDEEVECQCQIWLMVAQDEAGDGHDVVEAYEHIKTLHESGLIWIDLDEDFSFDVSPADPDEVVKIRPIWDPVSRKVRHGPRTLH